MAQILMIALIVFHIDMSFCWMPSYWNYYHRDINGSLRLMDYPTSIPSTSSRANDVVGSITVTNGGGWGDWKAPVYCPHGTYAIGYKMAVSY